MKILNLYAGIGGNRKFWGNTHEITAVEINKSIAVCYKDLYPDDHVIVGDAHQYLLNHYHEFDFIWSSPPCQTHSRLRTCSVYCGKAKAVYPDMKLYQEIILLKMFAKCDWVVENVIPYYKPLIQPSFTIQRHHFWSNKFIFASNFKMDAIENGTNKERMNALDVDLSKYEFEGINKRQILRNCMQPELGAYIFEQITGTKCRWIKIEPLSINIRQKPVDVTIEVVND